MLPAGTVYVKLAVNGPVGNGELNQALAAALPAFGVSCSVPGPVKVAVPLVFQPVPVLAKLFGETPPTAKVPPEREIVPVPNAPGTTVTTWPAEMVVPPL